MTARDVREIQYSVSHYRATRRHRLVRSYECLAQTLANIYTVALLMLMLKKVGDLAQIHNTL